MDVRNPGEWNNGVIENAKLIALADLEKEQISLDKNQHYFIHRTVTTCTMNINVMVII